MPLSLLVALVLAFGFRLSSEGGPLSPAEVRDRTLLVLGGLAVLALTLSSLGATLAWRIRRVEGSKKRWRRWTVRTSRAVDLLSLVYLAWIVHIVDWPQVVESGFGLGRAVLIDDFLIILPYLLAQVLLWWGLYPAERALNGGLPPFGMSRRSYLVRKARHAFGLVLPAAMIYAVARDLVQRAWPGAETNPYVQLGGIAFMGAVVLVFAPLFVRIAWPMRRLPESSLRERLLRLARRHRFRCTDILVWDTGGSVVNAGVTGALPWFRYVFLTDALIDSLEEHQVEAVFGHEVGHIAHRHLGFFGLFFVCSMGFMALVSQGVETLTAIAARAVPFTLEPTVEMTVETSAVLAVFGLYIFFLFGFLSRRFERQADVFGCRAVSCGRPECPPHADMNGWPGSSASSPGLCPVGIRIFADALAHVANLNGMEPGARSWRHGSIRRRIAFLEGLEGHPDAERRFQRGLLGLRLALLAALVATLAGAIATGALDQL